jgi:Reverse transcriptase (RNA-dependent DNA polymerase)
LEPGALYRIAKYLYGLPDAGLAYYKAYSAHLEAGGYIRTISDPCLFVKVDSRGRRVYVFCHVDDTMVCADDPRELLVLQNHLRKKFEITVTEEVTEYLGIKMSRLADGNVLLTQPKLLGQLEEEYEDQLATFRRVTAPQVKEDFQSQDPTAMDRSEYLHLVGALLYLTKSRPDIQTAVSFGATHSAAPTRGHYNELLRCLAYLVATRNKGLVLRAGVVGQPLKLTCYTDASYLTHADSKSHSGYCMSFGTVGTFYSKSGKQQLVATSSTHSEMRGLYSPVVDIVYLVHLCDELHRPLELPCIALVDNQPVIDLVSQPSGQVRVKRCKHFLMLVDWVREQVIAGYLELVKVATEANVADLLTKIVTGGEFKRKADLLLG